MKFFTLLLFSLQGIHSFAQLFYTENTLTFAMNDYGQTLINQDGDRVVLGTSVVFSEQYFFLKSGIDGTMPQVMSYGGNGSDRGTSIVQLSDGSYITGGISSSEIGGNKTSPAFGYGDFWITKISSTGTILWDKTFGTTQFEYYCRLLTINDTVFIIGSTYGGIDGTKTLPSYGQSDLWIIALDSAGNELYQRVYGGYGEEAENTDWYKIDAIAVNDQILITVPTTSGISGNKNSPAYGGYDTWVLLLDHEGNLIHEQTIGGSGDDFIRDAKLVDGRIVLAGVSNSPVSGNKTAPKIGETDGWVVWLDNNLNLLHQQTYGEVNGTYLLHSLTQFNDQLLVVGKNLNSSIIISVDSLGLNQWSFSYFTNHDYPFDLESINDEYLIAAHTSNDYFRLFRLTPTALTVNTIQEDQYNVYPNPFENTLYINAKDDAGTLSLCDQTGKIVKAVSVNNGNNSVDLSELESGVYFLQQGKTAVARVVKM